MEVMIGVDPHKASHHVFAVDGGEAELAQLSVRACREQVRRLLAWAEPFERRTWAVEDSFVGDPQSVCYPALWGTWPCTFSPGWSRSTRPDTSGNRLVLARRRPVVRRGS